MYIPDSHPNIGIETVPYDLDPRTLFETSLEISSFMRDTVQYYYTHDLGLNRIDTDPEPGTPEEIEWRMGRLAAAESNGVEYMVARYISGHQAADPQTALAGLLVTKVHQSQEEGASDTIEIVEWDVAQSERRTATRRGLGSIMLAHRFERVPDDFGVTLEVAEANMSARSIYERYGFQQYGTPQWYGIFDTHHLPMAADAKIVKRKLNIV